MMNWFRSWHGAPLDPKWAMIARRASVEPGVVSAIFWALLDYASQQDDRGSVAGFDAELYAAWSGWDESRISAVLDAMHAKGVILPDDRLAAWDYRQPQREDNSAPRVRAYRQRAAAQAAPHGDAMKPDAPPANPADPAPQSLAGWLELLKPDNANRPAILRRMIQALYPGAIETPDFAYIGKVARQVGGWGRLTDLIWQTASRPPTGDLLAYIQAADKSRRKNGSDPASKPPGQETYDELKAKYIPAGWEDVIEH